MTGTTGLLQYPYNPQGQLLPSYSYAQGPSHYDGPVGAAATSHTADASSEETGGGGAFALARALKAPLMVFRSSMAMVIGPTPPGTCAHTEAGGGWGVEVTTGHTCRLYISTRATQRGVRR